MAGTAEFAYTCSLCISQFVCSSRPRPVVTFFSSSFLNLLVSLMSFVCRLVDVDVALAAAFTNILLRFFVTFFFSMVTWKRLKRVMICAADQNPPHPPTPTPIFVSPHFKRVHYNFHYSGSLGFVFYVNYYKPIWSLPLREYVGVRKITGLCSSKATLIARLSRWPRRVVPRHLSANIGKCRTFLRPLSANSGDVSHWWSR